MEIKVIKLSDIARCPDRRMDPAHYRANGTCMHDEPHILATEPPTSSCCNSEITVQRVVTDTIAYVATKFESFETTPTLYYRFGGKTYDDPDGVYSVTCSNCGADLYAANLNLEEI